MEPVSLGVGVVGLAALFNSVVEACNQINAYRHAELDLQFVATRLENLKHILNDWAEKAGIDDTTIRDDHHAYLDNPKTRQRVKDTLEVIREFIERVNYTLLKRQKTWSRKSRPRKTSLDAPEETLPVRPRSPLRKALWAIVDKENVLPNVDQLDALVNELHKLVPVEPSTTDKVEIYLKSRESPEEDISGSTESKQPSDEDPNASVQRREEVKLWLNACSTEATYEALRDCRTENTCQWVLQNPKYRKWLEQGQNDAQSRTLWLNAPPGCGKSVLSAFLIEHHAKVGATLYFFCSGSEEATRRPVSILRSCMMQATKHTEALAIAFDHKCKSDNLHASESDLWRLIQDLLRLSISFTFVVDGFDECSDFETNAARKFLFGRSSFLRRLHQSFFGTNSRLLVVSRLLPDIASALSGNRGTFIDSNAAHEHTIIKDDVSVDVERFATNLVRGQLPHASSVQQDDVSRQLAKKSEGAFLWVLLQKRLLTPVDTIEQVQQQISLAPTELPNVYNSDWQRIQALPEIDKKRSLLLLRWVTFATRPLGILELFDAIKIEDSDEVDDPNTGVYYVSEPGSVGDQSIRSELTRLAGTFASLRQIRRGSVSGTTAMEIAHITAKWFLFRMFKTKSPLGASPVKDNTLASLCLRYLNRDAIWKTSESKASGAVAHPFRHYAVMNWTMHADPLREGGIEFEALAQQFFSPANKNWLSWRQLYEDQQRTASPAYFGAALSKTPSLKSHEPGSITYYASKFGLNRILRHMEGSKSLELNKLSGLFGTPLQAASVEAHLPTVLWLLRYGAQQTIQGDAIGSALHTAVYSGNVLLVAALLRKGADANRRDTFKRHPMHIAAQQGYSQIVGRLITAHGAVNGREGNSWYPLIIASRYGHRAVVEKLLEAGADTACCTKDGEDALIGAAIQGDCEILRRLLDAGARVDRPSLRNWCALHYAISNSHVDASKLLFSYHNKRDCTSAWNSRALGLAAQRGLKTIVEDLLNSTPCSHNLFIDNGRLAIHLAAAEGHAEIIKLLHTHGADINALSYKMGASPLATACRGGHEKAIETLLGMGAKQTADSLSSTPVLLATASGSLRATKMLIENGADIHVVNNRESTPFYIACGKGFVEIARLLVAHGANVLTPKKGGWTPLHYASEQGFYESVKLCLQNGAEINGRNVDKATPLYVASGNGRVEIVKLLLEHGADIHITSKNDWTPLHYATERGHLEIVDVLLERGADPQALNSIQWTPFHVAARYDRLAIYERLQQDGGMTNFVDKSNLSLLALAVVNNHIDIVRQMAKDGFDLNRREKSGETLLSRAVSKDLVDMVKCLLEEGADPDVTNSGEYKSALDQAIINGNLDIITNLLEKRSLPNEVFHETYHPLRQALQVGKTNVILSLIDSGFKIESSDHVGRNALHSNLSESALQVVRQLPKFHDATQTIDRLGCSALHYISRTGSPSVIKWAAKEAGLDVNRKDNHGWTPLHWAAYFTNTPGISTLLELGADTSLTDAWGREPLRVARLVSAKPELVQLLQEHQGSDDAVIASKVTLRGYCDCCLHDLIDFQLHCSTCGNYDLCFRCALDRNLLHSTEHDFVEDFRY